jgi:hypothetical protein
MRFLQKKLWLPLTIAFVTVSALGLGTLAFKWSDRTGDRDRQLDSLPSTILWAWERPENLSFIDKNKVGVAFLAKTLTLSGDEVVTKPRLQPLKLPEGVKLVSVVRIEADRRKAPVLSEAQLQKAAAEVSSLATLRNVSVVQIDFDAVQSERTFYRQLLLRVRQQLSAQVPLSITALASWCSGDNWLKGLPVDEAVPMFFRMGVERRQFESRLAQGTDFVGEPCRNAAGVSTDELVKTPNVQRLYIFDPNPWSPDSVNRALEAYKR